MTKFFLLILFIIATNFCHAGVTVVGTRFFINEKTKVLNIKVINDNDNDYMIKTTVNSSKLIVSPPLFILKKNTSNLISIFPVQDLKSEKDIINMLTITTIPKSNLNMDNNTVSLAVRSHFQLIYQHRSPSSLDLKKIELSKSDSGEWFLKNPTRFAFLINISEKENTNSNIINLLGPGQKTSAKNYCNKNNCSLWITIFDKENNIEDKINLKSN